MFCNFCLKEIPLKKISYSIEKKNQIFSAFRLAIVCLIGSLVIIDTHAVIKSEIEKCIFIVKIKKYNSFICEQQFWNDAIRSGGIRSWPRQDIEQPIQRIDSSYQVVEVPGAIKKNCTGSGGNCIPKCFAEKGNRGFPGIPGLPGPKGLWIRLWTCWRKKLRNLLFSCCWFKSINLI